MSKRTSGAETIIVACIFFAAWGVFAISDKSEAATLPYYNLQGYKTTLVNVNATGQTQTVSIGGFPFSVGPRATFRFDGWPHNGGGIANVDAPNAYVEVADDFGSRIRIPALSPFSTTAQVQDLVVGQDQRAYVFISADYSQPYRVEWFKDDVSLSVETVYAEPTAIIPVPIGANRATVTRASAGPEFYVFAYHRRQSGRFELQFPVTATEVK